LSPCSHLDYFNDVFNDFSRTARASPSRSLWTVCWSDLNILNILICVPKMKEGLTGLEQHEGE